MSVDRYGGGGGGANHLHSFHKSKERSVEYKRKSSCPVRSYICDNLAFRMLFDMEQSNISALSLNYISEVSKVQNKVKPSGGTKKSQYKYIEKSSVQNKKKSVCLHGTIPFLFTVSESIF